MKEIWRAQEKKKGEAKINRKKFFQCIAIARFTISDQKLINKIFRLTLKYLKVRENPLKKLDFVFTHTCNITIHQYLSLNFILKPVRNRFRLIHTKFNRFKSMISQS